MAGGSGGSWGGGSEGEGRGGEWGGGPGKGSRAIEGKRSR